MTRDTGFNKWMTYKVPAEWADRTVQDVLKGPLLLSNRMINRLTRIRGIRLNGKTPWLQRKVKEGDRLQIAVRPREKADLTPEPVPFETVYEDGDWMVVNKPAGIQVHPVRRGETGTLSHGILHRWKEQGWEGRVRPVHRLDRHTSGLLLVAKSAYAHQLMDRELRKGRIRRVYFAFLKGKLSTAAGGKGTIDAPIARDPNHSLRRIVSPDGDRAVTHYRIMAEHDEITWVEVRLETGRTHQIRVHFAHLGFPLLGDKLYGGSTRWISRQALHAARLSFTHPLKGEPLAFEAPLPEDMYRIAQRWGFSLP